LGYDTAEHENHWFKFTAVVVASIEGEGKLKAVYCDARTELLCQKVGHFNLMFIHKCVSTS
jgi:hypothetical protein